MKYQTSMPFKIDNTRHNDKLYYCAHIDKFGNECDKGFLHLSGLAKHYRIEHLEIQKERIEN